MFKDPMYNPLFDMNGNGKIDPAEWEIMDGIINPWRHEEDKDDSNPFDLDEDDDDDLDGSDDDFDDDDFDDPEDDDFDDPDSDDDF